MNLLLITSTIAPHSSVFLLAHRDPGRRLQDYIQAMEFYTKILDKNIFDRIIYVDNSGYPLDAIEQIAKRNGVYDRCEFISFMTVPVEGVSRYYLEVNLIQEAMQRSALLADDKASIWKVTGRYIVANIDTIVSRAPQKADLYINCRNYPERVCDFYLARFNGHAYRELISRDLEAFKVARSGEVILRERIDNQAGNLTVVPRFNVTPRLEGVRGWDGARYGGAKDLSKYYVRAMLNRIAPGLWL